MGSDPCRTHGRFRQHDGRRAQGETDVQRAVAAVSTLPITCPCHAERDRRKRLHPNHCRGGRRVDYPDRRHAGLVREFERRGRGLHGCQACRRRRRGAMEMAGESRQVETGQRNATTCNEKAWSCPKPASATRKRASFSKRTLLLTAYCLRNGVRFGDIVKIPCIVPYDTISLIPECCMICNPHPFVYWHVKGSRKLLKWRNITFRSPSSYGHGGTARCKYRPRLAGDMARG